MTEIKIITNPKQVLEHMKTEDGAQKVLAVMKGDENDIKRMISGSSSIARETQLEAKLTKAENLIERLEKYYNGVEKLRKLLANCYNAGCNSTTAARISNNYVYVEGDLDKLNAPQLTQALKELLIVHWKEEESEATPLSEEIERHNNE